MVVFTCSHCGESVNKPKVEKHYLTKCRNRTPNLSCMDCFKDFIGQDYEGHTKCISEEQRYSAKGFVAKAKKGEEKQNTWVSMVQTVLDEQKHAPKNVIRIIEEICKHTNTPRKKPKFINFVKNVCGHRTMPNDIEAAWDLISVKLNDLKSANQSANQNGTKENGCAKSDEETKPNGTAENEPAIDNGDVVQGTTNIENGDDNIKEPLSKKQRKEEKKRRKYEAELQSASVQPPEEEEVKIKKNKKKSKPENTVETTEQQKPAENDINIEESDMNAVAEKETKQSKKSKKRKHSEQNGEAAEVVESQECTDELKPKKKKMSETEKEVSSLHELNVASEEQKERTEKFDWHGTIISLLQKKGNEMPFKRLQKKVLAEYVEQTGKEADGRIAEKLVKKLKSASNVKVDKNRVLLVE